MTRPELSRRSVRLFERLVYLCLARANDAYGIVVPQVDRLIRPFNRGAFPYYRPKEHRACYLRVGAHDAVLDNGVAYNHSLRNGGVRPDYRVVYFGFGGYVARRDDKLRAGNVRLWVLVHFAQQIAVRVQHGVRRARVLPYAYFRSNQPGTFVNHHLDSVRQVIFAFEAAPRIHQRVYRAHQPTGVLEVIKTYHRQVAFRVAGLLHEPRYVAVRPYDRDTEARRVRHLRHVGDAVSVRYALGQFKVGLKEGVHEDDQQIAQQIVLGE